MTVTLSVWFLPLMVTLVIWVTAIIWPVESQNDMWGFGSALEAFLRLILAVILTLLVWLVFFASMWWAA